MLQYRYRRLVNQLRRYALDGLAVGAQLLDIETDGTQVIRYLLQKHHVLRTETEDLREEQLLHGALSMADLVYESGMEDRHMGTVLVDQHQTLLRRD